jgi:hypothetical protein
MIIASVYNVIWYIRYCLSCVSAHAGSISNLNIDFNHNVNPSPIIVLCCGIYGFIVLNNIGTLRLQSQD